MHALGIIEGKRPKMSDITLNCELWPLWRLEGSDTLHNKYFSHPDEHTEISAPKLKSDLSSDQISDH